MPSLMPKKKLCSVYHKASVSQRVPAFRIRRHNFVTYYYSDCSGQIVKRVRAFVFKRLQTSHAFQERRLKNAPVNEKTEPLALTVGQRKLRTSFY